MWHPVHIDGRSVVVLRALRSIDDDHEVIESGRLEFDGEALSLVRSDGNRRRLTDMERDALQPVNAHNRIDACRGFDFFLLRNVAAG